MIFYLIISYALVWNLNYFCIMIHCSFCLMTLHIIAEVICVIFKIIWGRHYVWHAFFNIISYCCAHISIWFNHCFLNLDIVFLQASTCTWSHPFLLPLLYLLMLLLRLLCHLFYFFILNIPFNNKSMITSTIAQHSKVLAPERNDLFTFLMLKLIIESSSEQL